jgi:hypothetical protein
MQRLYHPPQALLRILFGKMAYIKTKEIAMTEHKRHTPWYLWPFVALWKLIAGIVAVTGRLVAVILGLVLMIVGVIVSLTVVGAIVGIPLAILGLLLILRGLF